MPSDLTAEFTVESMRELFDHVQQAYSRDRTLTSKILALHWGEHKLNVIDTMAKDRKRKVQPERMVTEEASRIHNLLDSFYTISAKATMEWKGEGSRATSVADRIEIAANEGYDQLNPSHHKPRSVRVFDQIVTGKGATLGPMPGAGDAGNPTYWYDFPDHPAGETERRWQERYEEWRKAGPLPFVYVSLPGDSTFPASYGLVNDLCVSVMSVSYWDLVDMFSADELGPALGNETPRAEQMFTLAMTSNREHLAYALMEVPGGGFANTGFFRGKNDHLLRSVEHGMGRSVIRIAPGITRSPHRSQDGYGHYWLPAIYHVADLIVQADRMLSIAATAAKQDALPTMKRFTSSDIDSEGAAGKVEWVQEGDIIDFPLNSEGRRLGDMEPMIQPRFGEQTQALVAWLLGRTARLGGAGEIMEGMSAEITAWATNQAVQLATSRHAPLTNAVATADMADYEMLMRATEVHGHDIDLRSGEGATIKLVAKEMAQWRPTLKVEYKPRTAVNRIALLQTGIAMMQAAAGVGVPLAVDYVMEDVMDIEQPWEMYRRWIMWKAALDPRTYDRLYARRMDEADATLSEEEGISPEQMQQDFDRMNPDEQMIAAPAFQALMRQAQGAGRAGAPFSTGPGGPQPMETTPGVTA
jgi:hypothetical protein